MLRKAAMYLPSIPRRSLPPVLLICFLAVLGCSAPFFRQLQQPSHDPSLTAVIPEQVKPTNAKPPPPSGPVNVSSPIAHVPELTISRAENITLTDTAFVYFEPVNAIIRVHPKSGSNAVFTFLYHAMFGKPYNSTYCDTYIQNVNGHCWKGKGQFLFQIPLSQRLHILTSKDVLRVAIQRDPYERMLSAFKGKLTCDRKLFKSDPPKEHILLKLREQGDLPPSRKLCMSLEEFADCLYSLHNKLREKKMFYKHIESHVRPLRFFFDEIKYGIVADITEAIGLQNIRPLWERFPYRHTVPNGIMPTHTSSKARLVIPKAVEEKIRLYASLSETRDNPGYHIAPEDEAA